MQILTIFGQWVDISGEMVADFVKQYDRDGQATTGDLQTWVILLCLAGF